MYSLHYVSMHVSVYLYRFMNRYIHTYPYDTWSDACLVCTYIDIDIDIDVDDGMYEFIHLSIYWEMVYLMCCSVSQCVAVSAKLRISPNLTDLRISPELTKLRVNLNSRHVTHCNTLQHTAAHYNTLQHTATRCSTLQHTATHYDTLQHTATHRLLSHAL